MPMLAPETLALVTVTHNSAAELEALLTSIERHLPGVELVVVDSASSDETVAVARSGRPRADDWPRTERGVWPRLQHRRRGRDAARDGARQSRCGAARRLAARARGRGTATTRATARAAGAQLRRLQTGHRAPAADVARRSRAGAGAGRARAAARGVAACPVAVGSPSTGRMGGRVCAGRADRHAPSPGPVRRADLSVLRGPRPGAARGRAGDRDVVLARRLASSITARTRATRSSAASHSNCSRAHAATSSRAGSVRGGRASTTRHRPPRSRRGS